MNQCVPISLRAMRVHTLLLAGLMITMSLTPLISAEVSENMDRKIDNLQPDFESIEVVEPTHSISFDPGIHISKLDESPISISTSSTSGRAPCPAIQSDGGTAGDTGNTTGSAKPLGNDPNSSIQGCVDQTDDTDWYSVQISQNKNIDVVLTFTATDFDLGIHNGTTWIDRDWASSGTTERVSTLGTFADASGGTFYIAVDAYSGDGQYSLETWTNESMPKPDMTITMVEVPQKAKAGDAVTINYTVENLANNSSATTGSFEVFFILSTDSTYSAGDRILEDVFVEADLAAGASRNTSTSVTIPVNITNDSYHWIVWADGYGNITEIDELNNNMASQDMTFIGTDCLELGGGSQDDGGLGSDAADNPANSTNMGSNVTAQYTGCMDEIDGADVYAFDVPSGYFLEIMLDAEDQNSDFDLSIEYSNGSDVDSGTTSSYPETATAYLTDYEGLAGTYFVNVTHFSGISNYTLSIWTNQSIPAPDYTIDSISSAQSGQPGDPFEISAVLVNQGTMDGVANVKLTAILSVNIGVDWYDHTIGNAVTSGIPVNNNTTVTISSTIPASLVEGGYYLYVIADQDDLILERIEDNNELLRGGQVTFGNAETSCTTQNDAGLGGDAGNSTDTAYDLGIYSDAEYRGCTDSSDSTDFYKITLPAGQNLNVTLVDPPSGNVNLALVDANGNSVGSDSGYNSDSEISTEGTDFDGVAGVYTIMVNRTTWWGTGGAGTYRLLVGSPTEYIAPFSCTGFSDGGTGTDGGDNLSTPIPLGANPLLVGEGCLSEQDVSDAYQFSLADWNNVEIMLDTSNSPMFSSTLHDENGSLISDWNGSMWTSLGNVEHEGNDGTFTLVINSQGSEGYYNLSITPTPPAPADLAVTNLSCGSEMISNEELFYSFDIHNLRGPLESQSFGWMLELIDSNGLVLEEIDSSTITSFATYGEIVLKRSSSTYINSSTPTGLYSCRVLVNMDIMIHEDNIMNNELIGEYFEIQNEDQIWANDQDRDGYNTSDTGDGIIDECPDKFGESFGDRYGCPDLDADGWSNANDFAPLDETQWIDEDEDGFGDNISGNDGDQCPGIYGVENGDGGDGCPPMFEDTDGDGVQDSDDLCPNTPQGVTVQDDGCEIDSDGDGVGDSLDLCDSTDSGIEVDENGCSIDTTTDQDSDDNSASDDEEQSTEDSSKSGFDTVMIGGISAGVIIIVILSLLIVRKSRSGDIADDAFANAAFNDPVMSMAAGDSSITPQQLEYEQQLLAHGYTAEQARAYADQHFRPWLNQ